MNKRGIKVTGVIRTSECGEPVPNADVGVGVLRSSDVLGFAATTTDRDGRYSVSLEWDGPEEIRLAVEARAVDRAYRCWPWHCLRPEEWNLQTALIRSGASQEVNMDLAPGFSVDIAVRDPEGRPQPGVESTLICTNSESRSCHWPLARQIYGPEGRFPRTDIHGRLVWKGINARLLPGDRYVIALRHEKYVEHLIQSPENLPRKEGLANVTVGLVQGTALSGFVTSPAGTPVNDVTVEAIRVDVPAEVPVCHRISRSARSDEDGRYQILGLGPGLYVVGTEHADWCATTVANVRVGEADAKLDIRLHEGVVVSGRVLDPAGAPIVGARVDASWRKPNRGRVSGETDGNGTFRLRGLPKHSVCNLDARSRDGSQVYGRRRLKGSCNDMVFDQRELVTLSGTLLAPAGDPTPVPHAVRCAAWSQTDGSFLAVCLSGTNNGEFIVVIPAGRTVLTFEAGGKYFGERSLTTRTGETRCDIRVSAEVGAAFTVRVLDIETLQPVPEAVIELDFLPFWWRRHKSVTGESGEAVFANLPPGRAWLTAGRPGYQRSCLGRYRFRPGGNGQATVCLPKTSLTSRSPRILWVLFLRRLLTLRRRLAWRRL